MNSATNVPWGEKSVEQLIEEVNKAVHDSRGVSEQEELEYDAEYGYAPDETQQHCRNQGSETMGEIKICQIGNADIAKLKYDDIMLVALGEGGAMGEPGALNIICKKKGKVKVCHANFCYGDFDMDKLSKVFTPLQSFDCGLFGDVGGVAEGWEHIYMGMGNHLLVRSTIAEAFKAAIKGKAEPEIYGCYMTVATEILGGVE